MNVREIKLNSKVILAPMAGVSNVAYRKVMRKYFDGLICAEMVSDKALHYQNEKTLKMINIDKDEGQVSLQVFGGDVDTIVEAAIYIDQNSNCDIIDINMGCPVKKVLKTGGGSQLLREPDKVKEIVEQVVKNVKKPVSVKIRMGFDDKSINYLEIGKIIQDAGASAITLHGRTRAQFYLGDANWECIKLLKEALDIPVIGNGDINSLEDALKILDYTKCDAIMIGRASLGNPWLIQQIDHYFKTNEILELPTAQIRIAQALEHLDYLIEMMDEKNGVAHMRSHAAWYIKGLEESARVKKDLNQAATKEKMQQIFKDYLAFLERE